jgi:hypothetical protein
VRGPTSLCLCAPTSSKCTLECVISPNEKPKMWRRYCGARAGSISKAVYDSTGIRQRSVPFKHEKVKAALALFAYESPHLTGPLVAVHWVW